MQIGQLSNVSNANYDVSNYQPQVRNVPDMPTNVKLQSSERHVIEEHENTEVMDESLKIANKSLERFDRSITREIHPVTHSVMYKIVDTKTNNVIAEFPSKKIQDMIAKMWEIAGLVVDEKI